MSYYRKHLFLCTNDRQGEKKCCHDAGSDSYCKYAKAQIRAKGWRGKGGVRVSHSGCMGRCAQGPILVVYPDGIWYTYKDEKDIDEILDSHIDKGVIVERLLLPDE